MMTFGQVAGIILIFCLVLYLSMRLISRSPTGFMVEYGDEVNQILVKLAKEQGVTQREIFRRALALSAELHDDGVRIGGDKELAITPKDGDEIIKRISF